MSTTPRSPKLLYDYKSYRPGDMYTYGCYTCTGRGLTLRHPYTTYCDDCGKVDRNADVAECTHCEGTGLQYRRPQ